MVTGEILLANTWGGNTKRGRVKNKKKYPDSNLGISKAMGVFNQTWKLWQILGTGFPVGFWLGSRFLVMIPVLVANYSVIGKKLAA